MHTMVIPLGTASALPAHGRYLSSVALWRAGRILLFDCGEGAQYRIKDADLKRSRVDAIFITHLHGDHCFGLPGFLATLGMMQRKDPLLVVGPEGVEEFGLLPGLGAEHLPYELTFRTLPDDAGRTTVMQTDDFTVTARPLDHRTPTFGFRFEEPSRPGRMQPERARDLGIREPEDLGRLQEGESVETPKGTVAPEQVMGAERPGVSFAYVTDTRPCQQGEELARRVDLLVHDSTFGMRNRARAIETAHSTAREAAGVARRAEARKLLLTHFSARHRDVTDLVREARTVFSNTAAAEELKRYDLKSGEE